MFWEIGKLMGVGALNKSKQPSHHNGRIPVPRILPPFTTAKGIHKSHHPTRPLAWST
jgi:hypothetical protein